jgi:hypothetical protein
METYLWCFLEIFIIQFIEDIFEGSCFELNFELKKSIFEVKHTCTL